MIFNLRGIRKTNIRSAAIVVLEVEYINPGSSEGAPKNSGTDLCFKTVLCLNTHSKQNSLFSSNIEATDLPVFPNPINPTFIIYFF